MLFENLVTPIFDHFLWDNKMSVDKGYVQSVNPTSITGH